VGGRSLFTALATSCWTAASRRLGPKGIRILLYFRPHKPISGGPLQDWRPIFRLIWAWRHAPANARPRGTTLATSGSSHTAPSWKTCSGDSSTRTGATGSTSPLCRGSATASSPTTCASATATSSGACVSGDETGGWVYLYLLLEFQSTSDPFMAVRLLTYLGLLYEEIIQKDSLKPGDRLPAVLPLVLHNGKSAWRAPRSLGSLIAPLSKELRRHLPRLTYLVLDERRLDLDHPALKRNRAAALFRIEACETLEDMLRHSRRLSRLVSPEEEPNLWRTIHAWFTSVVRRTFPGAIISGEGKP
jgi:Putative transposase, YhgA-like